jgi:hypothetical protein
VFDPTNGAGDGNILTAEKISPKIDRPDTPERTSSPTAEDAGCQSLCSEIESVGSYDEAPRRTLVRPESVSSVTGDDSREESTKL